MKVQGNCYLGGLKKWALSFLCWWFPDEEQQYKYIIWIGMYQYPELLQQNDFDDFQMKNNNINTLYK
jgi:hypothetical protein